MPNSKLRLGYKKINFLYFEPFWSHLASKLEKMLRRANFSQGTENAKFYGDFKTAEKMQKQFT
jgi:hypothetical protein